MEITSRTGELITLAQGKAELGIVDTGEVSLDADTDARVTAAIEAARDYCEQAVDRTFAASVARRMWWDAWPSNRILELSTPPLISITAVTYYDEDNGAQTVNAANYAADIPTRGRGRLRFAYDYDFPTLYNRHDAVQVTYTTGYGDVTDIPPAAIQAAKLLLTLYFDHDLVPQQQRQYHDAAAALLHTLDWGGYG